MEAATVKGLTVVPPRTMTGLDGRNRSARSRPYFKPGNNTDPNHRFAKLLAMLSALVRELTITINDPDDDRLIKALTLLSAVQRKLSWSCTGMRSLMERSTGQSSLGSVRSVRLYALPARCRSHLVQSRFQTRSTMPTIRVPQRKHNANRRSGSLRVGTSPISGCRTTPSITLQNWEWPMWWRYKPSRHVLVYYAVTLLTSNEHDICQIRGQGSYLSHNLRKAAVAFTNTKNASTHFALPLPSAKSASPWMPEAHPPRHGSVPQWRRCGRPKCCRGCRDLWAWKHARCLRRSVAVLPLRTS